MRSITKESLLGKKIDFVKIGYYSLALVLGVFFLIFLAGGDLIITQSHSMAFLDCLFSGNFRGFYAYTLEHRVLGLQADYYILQYILFAIWNFPIWILSKLIVVPEMVAMLWCKCILLPFLGGTIIVIKKVLLQNDDTKDIEFVVFRICSSLCFALPIFTTGQYDILAVFLIFFAIWQCMKNEQITWKVLLIFALAIPLKVFAVFPLLFVVLLKEKRILYIVRDMAVSFIGLLLCIVPFINQPSYQQAMTGNGGWLMKMMEKTVQGGLYDIPIFPVILCLLCVFAYKTETKDNREFFEYVVWINATFFVSFFAFVEAHTHWTVYMIPFLVLCSRRNDKNFKLNIILEAVLNVSLILAQTAYFWWIYFSNATYTLIMRNVPVLSDLFEIVSLHHKVKETGDIKYFPYFSAFFLAAGIALLCINCPWKKCDSVSEKDEKDIKLVKNITYVSNVMILIIYGVTTLLITYVI